jgi:hypothetical protein
MEGILKLLKSLGLSEAEIKKVLERVPVNPQGLAGTNVAKGIFEKGGKEFSAEHPLVTETMVSPFKLNKYKGLSKEQTLQEAEKAIDYLDQELSRTSNLLLNENLKLTKEQEINFANNLRMKRAFEKELEQFRSSKETPVIDLKTKQPINKEGINSLQEKIGLKNSPNTVGGQLEQFGKTLEGKADELGKSKLNIDDILKDYASGSKAFEEAHRQGLTRATAREIMEQDIASGKLKGITKKQLDNGEPVELWRTHYGEDALEQLDSLSSDFNNLRTEKEAADLAKSKFKFKPKDTSVKESYTKEEMDKMLKDAPEYNAPKELTDDEMLAYIKNYKEKGPTLEEYTKKFNEEHGTNLKPDDLEQAHRIKTAYPHSTPIVDEKGKFIGGRLNNPPKDYDLSDRETLTNSIAATRRANGEAKSNPLPADKEYEKKLQEEALKKEGERAGQGRFTKQHVLKRIIQSTIDANPTDTYVQKTFPGFLKEISDKPELANNPNVWKSFTEGLPENQRLVVYGDDTVDFFTKGGPGSMTQVQELMDKHKIPYDKALRIKQMEPEDQVLEIKKLETLKAREEEGAKGLDYLTGGEETKKPEPEGKAEGGVIRNKYGLGSIASNLTGVITAVDGQPVPQGTFSGFQNLINQLMNQGIISPVSNTQTTQPDSSMSLKDQYLNRLAALQSSSPSSSSYQDFKNLLQSKLEGKAKGGRVGYAEGTIPSIKLPDDNNEIETDSFGQGIKNLPEKGIEGLRIGLLQNKRQKPIFVDRETGKEIDPTGGWSELKNYLGSALVDSDPMLSYGNDKFNAYVAKGINPYGEKALRYGASYKPDINEDGQFFIDAGPGFKAAGYGMTKDDTNFSLYGVKDTMTGDKRLQLNYKKDLPIGWSKGLGYLSGE